MRRNVSNGGSRGAKSTTSSSIVSATPIHALTLTLACTDATTPLSPLFVTSTVTNRHFASMRLSISATTRMTTSLARFAVPTSKANAGTTRPTTASRPARAFQTRCVLRAPLNLAVSTQRRCSRAITALPTEQSATPAKRVDWFATRTTSPPRIVRSPNKHSATASASDIARATSSSGVRQPVRGAQRKCSIVQSTGSRVTPQAQLRDAAWPSLRKPGVRTGTRGAAIRTTLSSAHSVLGSPSRASR